MRVVALVGDLIIASRILEAARQAGAEVDRIDHPSELPSNEVVDLLLVDWADRGPDWGQLLVTWRNARSSHPRVVLFGPHTDLAAHAAAREAGLGPMWARSKLVAQLPSLLGD
ncbi:MAG TPA: hypothetical protein VFX74_06330 [Candidatus Limnocylindria bacterium]|nr:hypothetical protein [Candidatus Limnocylindria bacterium]